MNDNQDFNSTENEASSRAARSGAGPWLIGAVIVLAAALGVALGYGHRQRTIAGQGASREADLNATITRMQSQIDTLDAKVNQPPLVVTPAPAAANNAQANRDALATKRRLATDNKRINALQSAVTDEQQQLQNTQQQLSQARTDLEGSVNSTRDELNGSIARTHDELVALEQKGERSYTEFDLYRAKHFVRTGPVVLSLRKADPKHKTYDIAMVIDDNQLSKKHVNLYEPVWINGSDMQQVQVVVIKIDKDHVHGYVNAPKYRESATLTAAPADRSNETPSGAPDSTANGNSNTKSPEPTFNQTPNAGDSSSPTSTTTPATQPQQ
jgi:hypothetical protein